MVRRSGVDMQLNCECNLSQETCMMFSAAIGSFITSDHGDAVLSREAINFPITISAIIATELNFSEPVGVFHSIS